VLREPRGERRLVSDQPDLGDTDQLGGVEGAAPRPLADAAVGDQLDDVPGGVVEVACPRVPGGEVEDDLPAPALRQQLDSAARPREQLVEAVTGGEQRDVVERRAGGRRELEPGLADEERRAVVPEPERVVERRERRRRRRGSVQPDGAEPQR
jgi:hypothetical protein